MRVWKVPSTSLPCFRFPFFVGGGSHVNFWLGGHMHRKISIAYTYPSRIARYPNMFMNPGLSFVVSTVFVMIEAKVNIDLRFTSGFN